MRSYARGLVCASVVLLPIAVHGDESTDELMRRGHWTRVRVIAQTRYQASPGSADANYLMGSVAYKWGSTTPRSSTPRGPCSWRRRTRTITGCSRKSSAVRPSASIFKQIGLAKRFRSETETVLRLDPRHIDAHVGMMLYYFKAPGIVGGDKTKAAAEAEAIGGIDRAKGFLAQVRLAQEQAVAALESAVKLDPTFEQARKDLKRLKG